MKRTITPGARTGCVRIPASKSQAHRLLICAALGEEKTEVVCDGISADIAATAKCLSALGAKIEEWRRAFSSLRSKRCPRGAATSTAARAGRRCASCCPSSARSAHRRYSTARGGCPSARSPRWIRVLCVTTLMASLSLHVQRAMRFLRMVSHTHSQCVTVLSGQTGDELTAKDFEWSWRRACRS